MSSSHLFCKLNLFSVFMDFSTASTPHFLELLNQTEAVSSFCEGFFLTAISYVKCLLLLDQKDLRTDFYSLFLKWRCSLPDPSSPPGSWGGAEGWQAGLGESSWESQSSACLESAFYRVGRI